MQDRWDSFRRGRRIHHLRIASRCSPACMWTGIRRRSCMSPPVRRCRKDRRIRPARIAFPCIGRCIGRCRRAPEDIELQGCIRDRRCRRIHRLRTVFRDSFPRRIRPLQFLPLSTPNWLRVARSAREHFECVSGGSCAWASSSRETYGSTEIEAYSTGMLAEGV